MITSLFSAALPASLNGITYSYRYGGYNYLTLLVSGAMVATYTLQWSHDDSNWFSATDTFNAAGAFGPFPVLAQYFRIKCTAYTSGSPLVYVQGA